MQKSLLSKFIRMVASPELIIDGTSSQENIEGTHERVEQHVNEELQQLTNEIGNNFYSINENGKVEYNMDLVQKYLETKKDKSYIELLNSQNTAAWIMAVQIVLCSVGYDVGKVDGVLKNKGAKTSKTIEQIIKFQKDNGLKPDGKPGSKTIIKLLEKLGSTATIDDEVQPTEVDDNQITNNDKPVENEENTTENITENITEEKFEALCFKQLLTNEEMRQVVKYANEKNNSRLSLRITSIKNQEQLEELGKIEGYLSLNNVKNLTPNQLESLCNVEWLCLNGLRKITKDQANILTSPSSKVKKLELESLDGINGGSMTDEIAKILAKKENDENGNEFLKIRELYVNPARLTENQKQILKNLK